MTDDAERPAQHSLRRSAILHLLPGALIVTCCIIAAPHVVSRGYPPGLALLIGFVVVGIPLELGYLLYQGKKRNQALSLRGIVFYREPMPIWQYVALFLLLFVVAFGVLFAVSPVSDFLATRVFSWLPGVLLPNVELLYPKPAPSAVLLVLVTGLAVDGIINPVVEELYFRGYLLPRLSRLGWVSPLVSAALFTLAHFWQPYNYPIIFLIQLPLVYIVYWKRNIYIAVLVHCAANTLGAVLSLVSFMGSG
jgi:membrane protease YdiL (CAAX protease family)